jgi:hypothetical protein
LPSASAKFVLRGRFMSSRRSSDVS